MPRVANHPRATARVISNDLAASSPLKSPAKYTSHIPLIGLMLMILFRQDPTE